MRFNKASLRSGAAEAAICFSVLLTSCEVNTNNQHLKVYSVPLSRHAECVMVADWLRQREPWGDTYIDPVLHGIAPNLVIEPYTRLDFLWQRRHPFLSRFTTRDAADRYLPLRNEISPSAAAQLYNDVILRLQRMRKLYTVSYDCRDEFHAAKLNIDPGLDAREAMLLGRQRLSTTVQRLSRPVALNDNVAWIDASVSSCALAPSSSRRFKPPKDYRRPRFWNGRGGWPAIAGQLMLYRPSSHWLNVEHEGPLIKYDIEYVYSDSCPGG